MFTWLNKQGVKSDLGFEVQRTGRFSAEYREGLKRITLDVESGGPVPGLSISADAFLRWDGSSEVNAPEEQQRLLKNFKDALEFEGLKLYL